MSLKLTNRLDQIENDIRLMLMLQKCGNVMRSNPTTSIAGSNPNNLNVLGAANRNQKQQTRTLNSIPVTLSFGQEGSSKPSKQLVGPITEFPKEPSSHHCNCASATSVLENMKPYCKKCFCLPELELEYEQTRYGRNENEVSKLKDQLSAITQSKGIAITMTKQLKKKYERMKYSLEETNTKLVAMSKENEFLCKCLDREKAIKLSSTRSIQNQIDGATSLMSTRLELEVGQERGEQIKSLQESVLMLSKQVQENDKEKQNTLSQRERLQQKLKRQKDITRKLSEVNQKLANSVKIKHESFMMLRNRTNKCQKEIAMYKSSWNKSQVELEKLRQELENERTKAGTLDTNKSDDDVLEMLKKAIDKERRASETIQVLNRKIRDVEEKQNKEVQMEITRFKAEAERLQVKVNDLTCKLMKCQEEDARVLTIKGPSFAQTRTNELLRYIEEQKRKIEELEYLRQQQDVVISSQNEQLMSKEEQIGLQERQNEIVREKCLQLDKQLELLRTASDFKEIPHSGHSQSPSCDKINELESKVEELRSGLESEKQNASKQEKLLQERNNELEIMKKSTAALEQSKEKLEMVVRELGREKEAARIVAEGLEKLNVKKEKLEDMMVDLEGACKELLVEKDQYVKLCSELEKKLDSEKMLRMQECQILVEEKNKAFEVARLAAMTLIETVDDYEILTKSQLEAKRSIANVIKTKQQKRRPGCPPVPSMKLKEGQRPIADKQQDENTRDSTPNSSIVNIRDAELVEDPPSTSECTPCTEIRYQTNPHCCATRVAEIAMGVQMPVATINPYNVQSALVSTTPYACWLRNCGFPCNQTQCTMDSNSCPVTCTNPTYQCHCGFIHSASQPKSAKIRAPIRVTSKKSMCACPRKKRIR